MKLTKRAGATIINSAKEVFEKSDLILKVKEPQFNNEFNAHEVDMMHSGQYFVTFLHPAAPANHDMIREFRLRMALLV